jgi:hypothetical protein
MWKCSPWLVLWFKCVTTCLLLNHRTAVSAVQLRNEADEALRQRGALCSYVCSAGAPAGHPDFSVAQSKRCDTPPALRRGRVSRSKYKEKPPCTLSQCPIKGSVDRKHSAGRVKLAPLCPSGTVLRRKRPSPRHPGLYGRSYLRERTSLRRSVRSVLASPPFLENLLRDR